MTIYDKPDHDAAIAGALAARNRLQAEFDAIKHSFDTCRIIDVRHALGEAERRLRELRREREGAQRVETARNSSIFFGSNN